VAPHQRFHPRHRLQAFGGVAVLDLLGEQRLVGQFVMHLVGCVLRHVARIVIGPLQPCGALRARIDGGEGGQHAQRRAQQKRRTHFPDSRMIGGGRYRLPRHGKSGGDEARASVDQIGRNCRAGWQGAAQSPYRTKVAGFVGFTAFPFLPAHCKGSATFSARTHEVIFGQRRTA